MCFELSARIQWEARVRGTRDKYAQVKKGLEKEKRLQFCSESDVEQRMQAVQPSVNEEYKNE